MSKELPNQNLHHLDTVYNKFTETKLLNRPMKGYSVFSVLFIALGELCAPFGFSPEFPLPIQIVSSFFYLNSPSRSEIPVLREPQNETRREKQIKNRHPFPNDDTSAPPGEKQCRVNVSS